MNKNIPYVNLVKQTKEEKREILKTKGNRFRTYLKISLDKSFIKSFDDYIIESR